MKILFVLKKQLASGGVCPENSNYCSSGLYHSAKFVVDMLQDAGIRSIIEEATDNNDIDGLVTKHRPGTVIVEALWVVPEKFDILTKLHPKVKWIVRMHSDTPFLASEGIAMDWIFGYLRRGVKVAFNSPRIARDLRKITHHRKKILYLPNYYPLDKPIHVTGDILRIGCFGAIRPMKNQLIQALAAIRFADETGRFLEFWVNGERCEQQGDQVLKNLRGLFRNTRHKLVEIPWLARNEFLWVMSGMNVALCDSFSETFCITAADAVNVGTPLICSLEVPWASSLSVVETTDAESIVRKLHTMASPVRHFISRLNRWNLRKYSSRSREIWLQHFQ